ncbi:hypothetical protein FRB95_013270 [Tulasnella sp. JGI-2019a]|nr:hypothetical protein FRB95_013270 [Tulasnella sp. JGI-2019a]
MPSTVKNDGAGRDRNLTFEKQPLKVRFEKVKRKFLYASSPSDSIAHPSSVGGSSNGGSQTGERSDDKHNAQEEAEDDGDWMVDKVVVDGDFGGVGSRSSQHPGGGRSESHNDTGTGQGIGNQTLDPSELADSLMRAHRGVRSFGDVVQLISNRAVEFYHPVFVDEEAERQFQKEQWHNTKLLAWITTGFLYLNWVLYLIQNHSSSVYEKVAYYGVGTLVTLPAPFFVGFNFPRKRPKLFHTWLMLASWFWGWSEVIQMKVCNFYPTQYTHQNCGRKDFLFMMTYAVVVPTMVLFAFNQCRLYTTIGATIQFILLAALIIPDQTVFVRNVISFVLMMFVFIVVHYLQEKIMRRNFVLRAQMKIAYKALQQSQIAEKQASNSKRRFVSYIFHEVRVPLNSAMLAYQNLQSNNAFEKVQEDQAVEIHALEGSLTMMQQVLNDVLDLQRMDAGRFESSPSPFPFHVMIQSLLGSLGVAATAKRLQLNVELDERIDQQAAVVGQHHTDKSLEGAWVVGDALRLRQILSNLGGNAVKFTEPDGGPVTVRTILIRPARSPAAVAMGRHKANGGRSPASGDKMPAPANDLEAGIQPQHFMYPPGYEDDHAADTIVIRMEVTDSGPGIRPSELEGSKLFTPFAQTKVGRSQAAKGSGLGLAIVRQIVALSGGRLGIISKKDAGSTFWIELGFRLATEQEILQQQQASNGTMNMFPPSTVTPASSASGSKSAVKYSTLRPNLEPSGPSDLASTVVGDGSPDWKALAGSSSMEGTAQCTDPSIEHAVASKQKDAVGPSLHPPSDIADAPPITMPPLSQSISNPLPNEVLGPTLPTKPTGIPAIENPSPQSQPPNDPPLKVLVVDDDPLTRTLMTRMLKRLGCEVETAENGQLALELLLGDDTPDHPPRFFDMISLDNAMPVMTGQNAVRRLRSAGRKDFVVGATGNALKLDQVAYLEAGADHVLAKPVMLKDIKAFLAIALSRRKATAAPATDSPP